MTEVTHKDESLFYDIHGGRCCGIGHTYGFSNLLRLSYENAQYLLRYAEQELQEYLDDVPEEERDGWGVIDSFAIEVVLTDEQLSYKGNMLQKLLDEEGYKKVFRWKNPNTKNVCNLFLKSSNEVAL